jgi:hypothetical protein
MVLISWPPSGREAAVEVGQMITVARWLSVAAIAVAAVGCDDGGPEPGSFTVSVSQNRDSVAVSWTAASGAKSYRAELRGGAGTLTKSVESSVLRAVFTAADGLEDDVTYTVHVFAVDGDVQAAAGNTPTVLSDFFPWDEYFETALHVTGQGKRTFYDSVPNRGFARFTGKGYDELTCKNCHTPSVTGGCAACHASADPGLGDTVSTTTCAACHGRQNAEVAQGFSDVHRDAGMDCMDCHTLGDVHGDGTTYASMLDPGAIDAKCENCHTTPSDNTYHAIHRLTVDCAACHTQSIITCHNCHWETFEATNVRKAYGQVKNWSFLLNRNGKVSVGNFQSLSYGTSTFVGFAPYYAHTIARNALPDGCQTCHNNTSVQDWLADGVIDVVTWDAAQSKFTYRTGVIPVPPNYIQGGLRIDFATLNAPGGNVWSFLKTGADSMHMLYATPLNATQMSKLELAR